jgi:DNA-binding CsgD family transcriptional regulator
MHHRLGAVDEKELSSLSRREAEVYCLTGCGYVSGRIAERMGIDVSTVATYLERIRKKLNLTNRDDLQYAATGFMLRAAQRGL